MDRNFNILDEIINEAKNGEVLNGNYLPLLFNTYEKQDAKLIPIALIERFYPNIFEPTLIIKNRNNLIDIIYKYLENAFIFYENEVKHQKIQNPPKFILYNRLSNMLLSDFDDLSLFFERENNFLINGRLKDFEQRKDLGYIDSLCGNLIVVTAKENIVSTTPFSIQISIERNINGKLYYYDFPCIKASISNGIGYIYEIAELEERTIKKELINDLEYLAELESYQISIKSLLKKGIKTNEINCNEIISLLVTTTIMYERGINLFIVPTIFINKYNGLEISCYKSIAKNTKIYDEAILKKDTNIIDDSISKIATLKKMLNEHEKIIDEKNTKLVKNFKYLEEIFSDYKITDLPMKKDTSLHFSITKNGNKVNNRLLEDILDTIHKYFKAERKDKIIEKL